MSFTITPEVNNLFNTFNMVEVSGVSFIFGGIFALLLTLIISTEPYHMKITLLPNVLLLHLLGIYQNIILILVAVGLFMSTALNMQVLKGGIQSIAKFASNAVSSVGVGYDTIKHKSYNTAKMLQSSKSEIESAKLFNLKNKFLNITDGNRLLMSNADESIVNTLSPLNKQKLIEQEMINKKNELFLKLAEEKNKQSKVFEDNRREKGKQDSLNRKFWDEHLKNKQKSYTQGIKDTQINTLQMKIMATLNRTAKKLQGDITNVDMIRKSIRDVKIDLSKVPKEYRSPDKLNLLSQLEENLKVAIQRRNKSKEIFEAIKQQANMFKIK